MCKEKQYETNGMIEKFKNDGYEITSFDNIADIYIVNTCTVTNISDRKSRQMLRQAKKNNPNSIVVACGCYVQVAKEEVEKIEEIDLCVGTNEKIYIVEIVQNYIGNHNKLEKIEDVLSPNTEYGDFGCVTYTEKTRAVIKVQDGCDRFCSYCIIPYARGKVRSRKPESVLKEIEEIAKNGIKEVVITGIHVASYGKDFNNEFRLIDLLENINKIDGIERIRLGSIEPLLITDEFVNRLSKLEKICHHFHLSLQSGCDETLKRMNRRYSILQFEEIVNKLRNIYNDAILTTDIIVGFPGETDEEFSKTFEFLRRIKFFKMHIFKFSSRHGTKAEKMENQVLAKIKELRSKKLIELSNFNETEYLEKYIGKDVQVLFEEKEGDYFKGHTSNYILVKTKTNDDLSNMIKMTHLEKIEEFSLIGNL